MVYDPGPLELLLLEHRKYNPNQPRDKSGRWGSGGGLGGELRPSLAGAQTADEVNAAAGAEAQRITGRQVRFELSGDPQIAAQQAEGVLKGMEAQPHSRLERVGVGKNLPEAMAGTDGLGTSITFYDQSASEWRLDMRAAQRQRELVEPTIQGVGIHEYGHAWANSYVGPQFAAPGERGGDALNRVAASTAAKQAAAEHTDVETVTASISPRASYDANELAAESFTDVVVNGSDANPLSRDIYDAMAAEAARFPAPG